MITNSLSTQYGVISWERSLTLLWQITHQCILYQNNVSSSFASELQVNTKKTVSSIPHL